MSTQLRFSDLLHQDIAVAAIRRAMSEDRLAATYLLVGPTGVGKSAVANAIAAAACCLSPDRAPFDACGSCESCRRIGSQTHPDIATISPAGDQLQIGQLWDRDGRSEPGALSRTLRYAPTLGKRRVYILERADTLTPQAANSLLKVLEEPPPYVLFVLLATHAARILQTITSRSQMLRIVPAPVEALTEFLEARYSLSSDGAETLARQCEGMVGAAVRYATHPAALAELAAIVDFAESLAGASLGAALRSGEQMRKLAMQIPVLTGLATLKTATVEEAETPSGGAKERAGRRQIAVVLDTLVLVYRDLLALSLDPDSTSVVNRLRLDRLRSLAADGDAVQWARRLDALVKARRRIDVNANIPLTTDVLAMELAAG